MARDASSLVSTGDRVTNEFESATTIENLLHTFLERNPKVTFHLAEYLESMCFVAAARRRFQDLCASFWPGGPDAASWQQGERVSRVARLIPAYAEIDWTRADYWRSIPMIDKESLRARPDEFVNPTFDKTRLWSRETSGTTGPPLRIWYSPEFAFNYQLFGVCAIASVAGALTDEMRNRAIFVVAVVDNKYLSDRVVASPDHFRGLGLQLVFDERDPGGVDRLAVQLERYRPAMMTMKPNVLESIVSVGSDYFRRASGDLLLIACSGADLDENLRRRAERLLCKPVYNAYGLTEATLVASECKLQSGLHLFEWNHIVELLCEDGRVASTGAGELVVSSIANEAMPLLRYRTGDLVEVTAEPCACGRIGRRLRNISGRTYRNFHLPDGSVFSPTKLNRLFDHFAIREFRLTQTRPDRMRLEVELLAACPDPGQTMRALHEHVVRELRASVTVDLVETVFARQGKFQRYRPCEPVT